MKANIILLKLPRFCLLFQDNFSTTKVTLYTKSSIYIRVDLLVLYVWWFGVFFSPFSFFVPLHSFSLHIYRYTTSPSAMLLFRLASRRQPTILCCLSAPQTRWYAFSTTAIVIRIVSLCIWWILSLFKFLLLFNTWAALMLICLTKCSTLSWHGIVITSILPTYSQFSSLFFNFFLLDIVPTVVLLVGFFSAVSFICTATFRFLHDKDE